MRDDGKHKNGKSDMIPVLRGIMSVRETTNHKLQNSTNYAMIVEV